MLLSNRILRLFVDAAERHGVAREELVAVLDGDGAEALAENGRVEWGSMVRVLEKAFDRLDRDPDRLRAVARDMKNTRSPDVVRELAAGALSPRDFFRLLDRWMTPSLPHLRNFMRFVGERRVQLHCAVHEPHAACLPFFYVFETRLVSSTEMMGLPPCTVVDSRITPRSADLVLDLPEEPYLRARTRRVFRSIWRRRTREAALEEQRRTLMHSIDALQRARDELRVLLDRIPDLVVVLVEGRVVWVNRNVVQTLGYERLDELVGKHILEVAAPGSRADVETRLRRPPDSPDAPALRELRFVTKSADEIVVEAAPAQAVVFDGVPARMIVARDVTERVRMQQKLIVADRLASVGLLAAGVAHEVNNPLAYVLNNIEIARGLGSSEVNAARRAEALGVALEGVGRIRVIMRDLLLLTRGDDAEAAIDVAEVIGSTLALAGREIERTAKLVTAIDAAPLVRASRSRVSQILLNLLSNALEAMRDRPAESNELRVALSNGDGRCLLEVTDTGIGISPAHLPRIFEPFFTTKPAGQGTGLGLAITQRLVMELGGEIDVTSEEGKGTTFRVHLPIAS